MSGWQISRNLLPRLVILNFLLILILFSTAIPMILQPLSGQFDPAASPLLIEQSANPATIQNIVNENACSAPRTPVDVVFSIDSSYSMEQNDPANLRLNAPKAFIDQLDPTKDRAAAVSWGGRLGYKSDLASNLDELKLNIDKINLIDANVEGSQQNTDYNIGIREAINILDSDPKNSSKIIIFLSDGEHNGFEDPPIPYEPNSLIDYATEKMYKIYAIGLNISSDSDGEKLLRSTSEPTGGKYFPSPSPENLKEIFDSIFVQEVQHFEFQPTNIDVAIKGGGGTSERSLPIDVVFSIDSSGSMSQTDPDKLRISSAKSFTDKLNPSLDQAGIVSWTDELEFTAPLTSQLSSLKPDLDRIGNSGDTDVNLAIREAFTILDNNLRTNQSSKAIVLITDGRSDVPVDIPTLTQLATDKGYKIYTIGLTIEKGSQEESELIRIASETNAQYYFPPTAENLQAAYEDIFERVIESTAPANLTLIETFPDYVDIYPASFTVIPTGINKTDTGQTTVQWQNISKSVGDKENKLSSGEEFAVDFKVGFNDNIIKHLVGVEGNGSSVNGSIGPAFSFKAPLIDEQRSLVRYLSPNGFTTEENLGPTYVNLRIKTCGNQEITGLAQESTQSDSYKRYSNPSYPFSIDYPSDWEVKESLERVQFDSPADHPYDKYSENVDVYVFETNYPTLRELVNAIIQDDKLDISGYNLTDLKSGSLGVHPSTVLLYTYSDSAWGPTKTMESISLIGDKYFLLSYSAKPLQFDIKLPIVNHMINSMTISP